MSFQSKYEYKSIDNSLLTPFFKKYIVEPSIKFISLSIHPNLITVISFIFSLLALWVSYSFAHQMWAHVCIGGLIFLYLLGDHLDGMQAKRRGGGTPLGEFLDHFLDVLTNGILLIILVNCFDVSDPRILFFMFLCSYIMQSFIFYEHYKTGWVVFGPFGAFEAVFSGIFFVILSGVGSIHNYGIQYMTEDFRIFDIMLTLISISGLTILYNISTRLGRNRIAEILILLSSIVIMTILILIFRLDVMLHVSIALTAIICIQEYMIARLTFKRNFWVDFLPIIAFLLLIPFGMQWVYYFGLAALIVIRFVLTIIQLTPSKTVK